MSCSDETKSSNWFNFENFNLFGDEKNGIYTIDALGAIFAIFTIVDTFTKHLQYFYNTFTILLQYYYNTIK